MLVSIKFCLGVFQSGVDLFGLGQVGGWICSFFKKSYSDIYHLAFLGLLKEALKSRYWRKNYGCMGLTGWMESGPCDI
jgi:hypothetical protein